MLNTSKPDQNKARFSIIGGLGFVSLTITDVTTYQNPEFYRKIKGRWQKVDQQVHGNDFWQTEYNAENGTWDITYNVDLDSPGDERQTVEPKFGK